MRIECIGYRRFHIYIFRKHAASISTSRVKNDEINKCKQIVMPFCRKSSGNFTFVPLTALIFGIVKAML